MPTFAEIEPLSLSDRVINALKDAFFAGELKPGDAIVIIAGVPFGRRGTTNNLRVARL